MKTLLTLIFPLIFLSMLNNELRAKEPKHSYSSFDNTYFETTCRL